MRSSDRAPFVHLELHTGDSKGARELCRQLCGWASEQVDGRRGSYLALDLGGALSGGIVGCGTSRPIWLPYVKISDIDRATELARRLGATILLEPREGPAGWRSVIRTREAGEIALWQQKEWRL
jgi:predicted enzyme related to lactoylglutathione lyase